MVYLINSFISSGINTLNYKVFHTTTIFIMILLSALILMILSKKFNLKDTSYKTALKISFILEIFPLVFLFIPTYNFPLVFNLLEGIILLAVPTILAIWLIKKNYMLNLKKSLLVWIVWIIAYSIVSYGIAFLVAVIFSFFNPPSAVQPLNDENREIIENLFN